ncbi:MAG TPA: acyltransferase [Candidatus Limnocylindrales bacterium]|nr:acyltransferase [Candidatus Limnocylindrales bacterium]
MRGIAILAVVGFHADLPIVSGGLVGVTLFFVLSGYLIASLVLREQEDTGTVDVWRFYARRAWRLLPALLTVTIALMIFGLAAQDLHQVAEDSLLTLAYLANWARSGGDEMGMWNHAWSLSIEAQFYVIAPLALLAVTRVAHPRSAALVAILVLALIASTFIRVIVTSTGVSPERVYFGTDTRMDALLFGCLIGAVRMRYPSWSPGKWVGLVSLVALAVLTFLPVADSMPAGFGYSLTALASSGVVVGALRDDAFWSRSTGRLLVWLGERSYALYLVHVPVFLLAAHALPAVDPAVRVGTAVLTSLTLSALLFRYVERPSRHGIRIRSRALHQSGALDLRALTRVDSRQEASG